MNDIPMYKRVHAYVSDHDVLQAELAEALNTSQQRISLLLTGGTRLTVDDLEKMMDYLGVSWETLKNYEVKDG